MQAPTTVAGPRIVGAATIRKLHWRIAIVSTVLFFFAFLDRSNVSLVAIQMNADLHFSGAVYGLGAGIFFLGYAVFEVPSNLILHRVGARIWIGRIMITWGIFACAMAFIQGATSFYIIRFLIGVAEAGFQPGIVYYLSHWYPRRSRAHAISIFNSAGPISTVIGAPITGLLLGLTAGAFGIAGWRWVFVLEGIPSILIGIWTLFRLPDSPRNAAWLEPDERETLAAELEAERSAAERERKWSTFEWLRDARFLGFCFYFFCMAAVNWGITFWLPQIINGIGHLSPLEVGLLTALPFLCAFLVMRRVAAFADRTGARYAVIATCSVIAGLGFTGAALLQSPVMWMICLCIASTAIWSCYSPFWTLPSGVLTGAALATGLAFINSIGQVGGLVTPYAIGLLKDATNSYQAALLGLAGIAFTACVIALVLRRFAPHQAEPNPLPEQA